MGLSKLLYFKKRGCIMKEGIDEFLVRILFDEGDGI